MYKTIFDLDEEEEQEEEEGEEEEQPSEQNRPPEVGVETCGEARCPLVTIAVFYFSDLPINNYMTITIFF